MDPTPPASHLVAMQERMKQMEQFMQGQQQQLQHHHDHQQQHHQQRFNHHVVPTPQPAYYAALPSIMKAPPPIALTLPNGATALTNSTLDTSVAKEAFDNLGETLCQG
jgi:hypothetical protein